MSETQLSDQYLYQSSLKSDPEIKVSSSKRTPFVIDLNKGSYQNGVITTDATAQLNDSGGFASLRDAYIMLPYKVSMKNGATAQTTAANRLCTTLKCGNWNVIDSLSLELNGKTIAQGGATVPNDGFVKRLLSNPPRSGADFSSSWPSVGSTSASTTISNQTARGAFVSGVATANGIMGTWNYMLR
ncbi:unnamed protein product [Phytophthora fragariaefolia]|uniref:Unnamed protein product n=1 Tax=Phytophthora fragariaefolia TaxID=1490495 RepID=A0A9W7D170_9STRA|nr:unnamed protein product [Phytophthora fragariaefolia]